MKKVTVFLVLVVFCLPVQSFAGKQEDRWSFIQELIQRGIFQKVVLPKGATFPEVWVKPAFYLLDFDQKNTLINVVYAYFITRNPKSNIVVLYDSKTGKEIGEYAEVYGGLNLK